MDKKNLSFVIPCYKSKDTICYLVKEIVDLFQQNQDYVYEIILVNDGSPDNTSEILRDLAEQYKQVIAIDLSKNFGQHSALMAAYAHVTGDYIVGMDDDGEHEPKDVFKLIDELEKGYDYVCANFSNNVRSKSKNFGTVVNHWMATWLVGKPKNAIFSSYYIMRRFVVNEIIKCQNPFPYVGGMITSITQKLSNVPIEQHKRRSGKSGYNFRSSLSLWLNGFTAFSVKPLRIATMLGFMMALVGFLYGVYVIIKKLMVPELLVGYASTIVAVLVIGGVVLISLGIIGEYIGRIYISINKVPQYVIREVYGRDDDVNIS